MTKAISTVFNRIQEQVEILLEPNGISLDLLRAVYRNPSIPLPVRMRAAMACLPFETPKLMAVAQYNESSFPVLLEKALARTKLAQIEGPKVIEARPNAPANGNGATDPTLRPVIPDRRYRRI